jgi:hypothetical protein
MPHRDAGTYHGYYNASPECWLVYTEHAGGPHPDKSVDVHLCGLHLVLVEGMKPVAVPPMLQRIASAVDAWPHFDPPPQIGGITVWDVALSKAMSDHIETVMRWARLVWGSWSEHHDAVAEFVKRTVSERT